MDAFSRDLLAAAGRFDLAREEERVRSVSELKALFFQFVGALQPGLFVEAGAMDGATAIHARRILPKARIVAFEANHHNYRLFSRRVDHAAHDVEYLHLALTAAPGPVTMRIRTAIRGVPKGLISGSNSLMLRTNMTTEYEESIVEGVTLDGFFAGDDSRAAMWVDVEGALSLVLPGAIQFLERVDALLVEVEERAFWEGQWLAKEALAFLLERALVPIARDFERAGQYNVLLARPSALAKLIPISARRRSVRIAPLARGLVRSGLKAGSAIMRLARRHWADARE